MKVNDIIRKKFMGLVRETLEQKDEEILLVKSNTFSIPWVYGDDEGYINITFSVPKGERKGDGYDGHAEAEDYALKQKIKAEKKAEAEAKKKAKLAKLAQKEGD